MRPSTPASDLPVTVYVLVEQYVFATDDYAVNGVFSSLEQAEAHLALLQSRDCHGHLQFGIVQRTVDQPVDGYDPVRQTDEPSS